MAERDLIEDYLAVLHRSLKWRNDCTNVIDEIEDHLRETVGRFTDSGMDPVLAQQTTLHQFGDPKVVATSFVTTTSGGIAVPTKTTRLAGISALVSAAMWLVSAVVMLVSVGEALGSWQFEYEVLNVTVLAASATFIYSIVGALLRSGGARGWWPGLTLGVAVLGTFIALVGTWAWPFWGTLLAIAALLTVLRLRSTGIGTTASKAPTDWLLVVAWPIGFASLVALSVLHVGTRDEYGDYPLAQAAGFAIGAIIFAVGLAQLGRWLRSEQPAEITDAVAA